MTSKGLGLLKQFEGFREEAYLDVAGVPTIGYGTTKIGYFQVELGMKINELVASIFLLNDVHAAETAVMSLVSKRLLPNEYDALISFEYNTGRLFQSTLLKVINAGAPIEEHHFTDWCKARVNGVLTPIPGLLARRKAEYNLYVKGKTS